MQTLQRLLKSFMLSIKKKKKIRAMLTVPALPKATQCYERGKKEETEKKLKNRVTPHHQAGSEYLTASPCPTNACSSQS